ncbi:GTPase-associated protein 1-related protein [Streptomyces abikoensis]|uniref:GTPase-associated protein 1-related protein n=1 Tax=Streptomyces abikoensis TaxID=97398 RepID=UPI0036C50C7C
MTLQQLHYTSAAPGPDGSGFRFTAVSDDLPAALLAEVEQLVGYEPPRDAPARPTAGELAGFPIAFSHHLLSDGSRLLCRAVYTGTDYSGRYGNFHAHAVRLSPADALPGGMLPIQAWESPFWADSTPGDGVPAGEPTSAGRIDKARLLEFVRARAERLEPFLADVRNLFRDPDAPQLLVVERDSADVAHWIAVASAVLPRERADRLTFTTYTRRPGLARQQIVGTSPDADTDAADAGRRFRVHDCAGGRSSTVREASDATDAPDAWASVAARLWLAGLPELVSGTVRNPEGTGPDAPYDAGRLAALAAREGVALDAAGRTAAARRAVTRPRASDRFALLTGLAAGGTARTAEEWTALAALADEFAPLAGHAMTDPLVRDLRAELARASDAPLPVLLSLHRLAEALRLDRSAVLPALTARMSTALLDDDEEKDRAAVRAALGAHPELAAAVLGSLDRTAATGDPAAVARALADGLPGADLTPHPHLRMAAAVNTAGDPAHTDRPGLLDSLMKAAGAEHQGEPSVLRTAVRLVWGDTPIRPVEAGILLAALPEAWCRAAGLDDSFVQAALDSDPDDPEAPELAKALLLNRATTLAPRQRAALLLLELAGDLTAGETLTGYAGRAVALRAQALPLEPGIETRVSAALAERLLDSPAPQGELLALVQGGDEPFLRAYDRAARREGVADRMRGAPEYAAGCFAAWQTAPGADALWEEIRTGLLTSVLRPVVRRMPAEDVDALLRDLRRRGGPWASAFQDWNRPGVLSRISGRWRARGGNRQGTAGARGPGDIEPPTEERP